MASQADRDIANELSQNLGTLAQELRGKTLEEFDEACLKRAEQLFARHRVAALEKLLRDLDAVGMASLVGSSGTIRRFIERAVREEA